MMIPFSSSLESLQRLGMVSTKPSPHMDIQTDVMRMALIGAEDCLA